MSSVYTEERLIRIVERSERYGDGSLAHSPVYEMRAYAEDSTSLDDAYETLAECNDLHLVFELVNNRY